MTQGGQDEVDRAGLGVICGWDTTAVMLRTRGIPAGILPWNEVKDGPFCLSVILDETVGICVMTREQARYSMRPLKGGLPG
jgi:hypothetical protein